MKWSRSLSLLLSVFLLSAVSSFAQASLKIEPIGAPSSSDLQKSIADALTPQGTRLLDAQGKAVAEIWWRKSVPTSTSAGGSSDILYGNLSAGTFVGVLHFPNGGSDFRGQPIPAGYFSLRYELIPQDGNHMGVSPYRDFLLLGPASADPGPDKTLSFDDVVKLSRKATGTGHPGVINLVSVDQSKAGEPPSLIHDDQGHWVLQVRLEGAGSGQGFPFAVTLVGKTDAAE